jgi:uroporphyrinogen-III synthase
MRVLVTRPEDDARALVAALTARGHGALVEPMLTIAPAEGVEAPLDLDGVQALVFTSANGVRAFARLSAVRALPAFTVGAASAAAARSAGFARVESAEGDVDDLARLIIARLEPKAGALYQAAARRLAGDLKGALERAGFTLRRQVLYEAKPVTALSPGLRADLAAGRLDAASFFSPRTAKTFVRLVARAGLGGACAGLRALALSAAVAAELRALPWREVLVAERPDQGALLSRLDALSPPLETEA